MYLFAACWSIFGENNMDNREHNDTLLKRITEILFFFTKSQMDRKSKWWLNNLNNNNSNLYTEPKALF